MGQAFLAGSDLCQRVYARAGEILGYDLAALCREGPIERLNLTEFTQPALLVASYCADKMARARGIEPTLVAGHSLGEYTALVSSGALEFDSAVKLVQNRGRYMQEAVPAGVGAMAAILGLDRDQVADVCREVSQAGVVAPANLNAPGQIVIAGMKHAVELAMNRAKERGAKRAIPLPVSVPSHCALMEPAARRLARDLDSVQFRPPQVPVVTNTAAGSIDTAEGLKSALVAQLESPVRWVESIEAMAAAGIDTFVEVGPGSVLSGLIRRISKQVQVFQIEDPESLEKTASALGVS